MENTKEPKKYQVAEIRLTYKSNVKLSLRPKIEWSRDAYNVFVESWDDTKVKWLPESPG